MPCKAYSFSIHLRKTGSLSLSIAEGTVDTKLPLPVLSIYRSYVPLYVRKAWKQHPQVCLLHFGKALQHENSDRFVRNRICVITQHQSKPLKLLSQLRDLSAPHTSVYT